MIDPTDMTAVDWVNRMSLFVPVIPMRISREEEWILWAEYVQRFPEISQFNPPNPRAFSNWREWAYRFNDTVPLD